MSKEIIKGVLAIIVVGGAVASAFIETTNAQTVLIPIAGFVLGYYFKQIEVPVAKNIMGVFRKR